MNRKNNLSTSTKTLSSWKEPRSKVPFVVVASLLLAVGCAKAPLSPKALQTIERDTGMRVDAKKILNYRQNFYKNGEPRSVWIDYDATGQEIVWKGAASGKWLPCSFESFHGELVNSTCTVAIVETARYNYSITLTENRLKSFIGIHRSTQN